MSAEVVNEAVMSAVASICRIPRSAINLETDLFDLGLDSIGLTAVVAHVEIACGAPVAPATLLGLYEADSIGDLIHILAQLPSARSNADGAGNGHCTDV